LEGIFWSGFLVVATLLFFAGELLLDAVNTLARFSAFGFHPNTLAFLLGTYFAVAVWEVAVAPLYKKILGALTALACLFVIFLASSRGSLVAAVVSSLIVGVMYCVHERKFKLLWGIPILLCLAIGIFIRSSSFGDVWESIDQVLQISSGGRGMGSGMSGRLDAWQHTWAVLLKGSWIYGNGVRSSDDLPYPVDNGFLVLLYDMGIVPFFIIVGRFISILRQAFRCYMATGNDLHMILFFVLLGFLINNIPERFLFGVGNPSSLFAVMVFASPWVGLSSRNPSIAQLRSNPGLDQGRAPA